MTIRLGCIADDFTGATDLANNLVRAGMRVVQTIGVPSASEAAEAPGDDAGVDGVVVALKSRTIEPEAAVAQSLAAYRFLRGEGATQIYFKVCSTFDSTPRGNIGPVLEALMDELGCRFTIATPAFPDNGRTVFKGHLFVGDVLLSDSGMRHHPLTPMTDANLVRVLQAQLHGAARHRVGLVDHRAVDTSAAAIGERFAALEAEGVAIAIVDAVTNDDLLRLGAAVKDLPLVCAGSGLAIGLPANFGIAPSREAARLPDPVGRAAIVSGSCSKATNAQVAHFIATGAAARALDPLSIVDADRDALADEIAAWAENAWRDAPEQPVLVYSTAAPAAVRAVQDRLGVAAAGAMLEVLLGEVARKLVERGARKLVVAGGETSGACVQALAIRRMRIGAQIDPGVPWCHAESPAAAPTGLHLALKSGNFGGVDFFSRAFAQIA
ncbi:MAG: 3-oxo-tetronate kinase [Caldimonas sp.]